MIMTTRVIDRDNEKLKSERQLRLGCRFPCRVSKCHVVCN